MPKSEYPIFRKSDLGVIKLRKSKPSKYNFAEMRVGDVFEISGRTRGSVASAASRYGTEHGKRFSCFAGWCEKFKRHGVWCHRIK